MSTHLNHDSRTTRSRTWIALVAATSMPWIGVAAFTGFGVRLRTAPNPLILPSILANRGFTSGLLLGLAYFAAVNGFAYVVSLYFQ